MESTLSDGKHIGLSPALVNCTCAAQWVMVEQTLPGAPRLSASDHPRAQSSKSFGFSSHKHRYDISWSE